MIDPNPARRDYATFQLSWIKPLSAYFILVAFLSLSFFCTLREKIEEANLAQGLYILQYQKGPQNERLRDMAGFNYTSKRSIGRSIGAGVKDHQTHNSNLKDLNNPAQR